MGTFNYFDLFCGIGGFHQGVEKFGKKHGLKTNCVFAADNDPYSSKLYSQKYGLECKYDLSDPAFFMEVRDIVQEKNIDLICGGFPCQTFSKAGNQEGFVDANKGNLFFRMHRIIKEYNPKFLLLENVRNLEKHDNKMTWSVIKSMLEQNYEVDFIIMGPNDLNPSIPMYRDRIFIMCYRKDIKIDKDLLFKNNKTKKIKYNNDNKTIYQYLNNSETRGTLAQDKIDIINMWEDLRFRIKESGSDFITPIWTEYFKEKVDLTDIPEWKQKLIKKNQLFYKKNKKIIKEWLKDNRNLWKTLNDSCKKYEWNAGQRIDDAWSGIIQFRPSGVRVKDDLILPTFVAINHTPIIGKYRRYITPQEMARFLGLAEMNFDKQPLSQSYKQLGNTVSVDVVTYLLEHMRDVANGKRE